jgi:antitoxin component YwqK of YwqJK toxin-antitoxin module
MPDLQIAEIPYPSGEVHFRYARYLSEDGTKWIRHGRFTAFHENAALASEGTYEHGQEHGLWRDYHPNGQLASEGFYESGSEVGVWRFWNPDGTERD